MPPRPRAAAPAPWPCGQLHVHDPIDDFLYTREDPLLARRRQPAGRNGGVQLRLDGGDHRGFEAADRLPAGVRNLRERLARAEVVGERGSFELEVLRGCSEQNTRSVMLFGSCCDTGARTSGECGGSERRNELP